ncbi:MAG TPA: GntR family transcriptional regulator, partial [Anaerolineaceae bacterium]|nr:GntR family transcriptional regulator [Anaerolineaceae bacterium]
EGQGLIRRKQGLGTFVVGRTQIIESGLEVLESIETLAQRIQLEVAMGALHVEHIPATAEMAAELQVEAGDRLVNISRVIIADHRPVAYLIDTLPENTLSPEELESGFTGSVLDLLLRKGEYQLTSSRTEIRAIAAPTEISRALEIQRGDVMLQFIAYLYTASGQVIDYSLSYFLPGYFRFHVVRNIGPVLAPAWSLPETERNRQAENV